MNDHNLLIHNHIIKNALKSVSGGNIKKPKKKNCGNISSQILKMLIYFFIFRFISRLLAFFDDELTTHRNKKCRFDFKGTVSVISSDPPRKNYIARSTTLSLKPLSDLFNLDSSYMFPCSRNTHVTFVYKSHLRK